MGCVDGTILFLSLRNMSKSNVVPSSDPLNVSRVPARLVVTGCNIFSCSLSACLHHAVELIAGRPWRQAHAEQMELYSELRNTPVEKNLSKITRLMHQERDDKTMLGCKICRIVVSTWIRT